MSIGEIRDALVEKNYEDAVLLLTLLDKEHYLYPVAFDYVCDHFRFLDTEKLEEIAYNIQTDVNEEASWTLETESMMQEILLSVW